MKKTRQEKRTQREARKAIYRRGLENDDDDYAPVVDVSKTHTSERYEINHRRKRNNQRHMTTNQKQQQEHGRGRVTSEPFFSRLREAPFQPRTHDFSTDNLRTRGTKAAKKKSIFLVNFSQKSPSRESVWGMFWGRVSPA